jgi:hypothetical protein
MVDGLQKVGNMVRQKTRARSWFGQWLALLLLGCVLTVTLSQPAQAVQVSGETTRVHAAARGQVIESVVILRNPAAVSERVRVYLTDYVDDSRLGWQFPGAGTLARSSAPWIDLLQTEVTLGPGEERGIFYRIAVPHEPEIRGTYWSSIMVEPQTAQAIDVTAEDPEEGVFVFRLNQTMRYQVAVIVNIGATGERRIAFAEPKLSRADDGRVVFEVLIENKGERWLNPDVWMELYDIEGKKVGHFTAGKPRILPGMAGLRQFDLSSVDPGEYVALILVDDSGDAVFGTRYSLRFTSGN